MTASCRIFWLQPDSSTKRVPLPPAMSRALPAPGAELRFFLNPFVLCVAASEIGLCAFAQRRYGFFSIGMAWLGQTWAAQHPPGLDGFAGSANPCHHHRSTESGQAVPPSASCPSQAWAWLQHWRDLVFERPLPQSAFE